MSALTRLARIWRCSTEQAEDALRHDSVHAKRVVGRRAFLGVATVLAAAPLTPSGTIYSFAADAPNCASHAKLAIILRHLEMVYTWRVERDRPDMA